MDQPRNLATEQRVLLLTPTARDAQLSIALLAQANISAVRCADLAELCDQITAGAGAVVVYEEALRHGGLVQLATQLAAQPVWSDLPVVVLVAGNTPDSSQRALQQQLRSPILLERPLRISTLLSAVQTALHTRARQYQIRLLTEVGQVLTTSLNTPATLSQLAKLLVPQVADACVVYLVKAGTLERAGYAFADPEHEAFVAAREIADNQPATLAPIWNVIERGQPEVREVIDPHLMGALHGSSEQQTLAERFGIRSHALIPLQGQGETVGVLALAMTISGRNFTPASLPFLRELTDRLVPTLENLKLYAAEQQARAEVEQAIEARDELIALISHDLKNPLTALLGHTQLLQRHLIKRPDDVERINRSLAAIEQAGLRMKKQINSMMDVMVLRAGQALDLQSAPADLVPIVRNAVTSATHSTEGHTLELVVPGEPLVGDVDATRIERVLDNLLSNAIKYSPIGGAIMVTLSRERRADGPFALVRVQDQGLGIPAEDLPDIFTPFRRATNVRERIQGTGLGLASVRQIVEAHGGWVEVSSTVGKGSTFAFALPLLSDPVSQ